MFLEPTCGFACASLSAAAAVLAPVLRHTLAWHDEIGLRSDTLAHRVAIAVSYGEFGTREFGRREGRVLTNDDVELSQLFPPFSCFSLGAVEKGDCYSLAMYAKGFRAMRDETWKGFLGGVTV